MIFVDANVVMYAAGKEHPYKAPCLDVLRKINRGEMSAISDVEVLQEILYRYWHLHQLEKGLQVFLDFNALVPIILDVKRKDLLLARQLLSKYRAIKPRDALHAAVMKNNNLKVIISADQDFDEIAGIERIDPMETEVI